MYKLDTAAGLKIFTLGLIAAALVVLGLFAAGSASAGGGVGLHIDATGGE